MSGSVFWAVVRRDLRLMRPLMIAMIVLGLASWFAMRFGRVGYAVGGILFLTVNVAGAIFIAMFAFLAERKEQARLFALSLPIAGTRYDQAKLVGGLLSFGIPWLVLTAVALLGMLPPGGAERGLIVYGVLLQMFVMAQFCVVMAWLFVVFNEHLAGIAILFVNIGFSLFMVVLNQPDTTVPWRTETIVWTAFARWMLAGELLVILLSLAFIWYVISRRRDHI